MIRFATSVVVFVGLMFVFISESHAVGQCSIVCSSCTMSCSFPCDDGTPGNAEPRTCGQVGMCKAKPWNCSSAREPGPFAALLGSDPADQSVPPTCQLEELDRAPAPKALPGRPVARRTTSG